MGYTVDRWKNSSGDTSVLVTDSGLTMVGGTSFLSQKVEDSLLSELDGKIITISSLWTDNVLQTFSWVLNKSQSKVDNDGFYVYTPNDGFFISRHIGEIQKTILAVKLELGTQQTLAHKENGVWVLNEIPKFGDQLMQCYRYAQSGFYFTVVGQLSNDGTGYNIPLGFSHKRANPTVTVNGVSVFGWGDIPISGATVSGVNADGAFISITDLSNKDNFIGKACVVNYFASAEL